MDRITRITADFLVELYCLEYSPDHKWHWLSDQGLDALLPFANYTSNYTADGPQSLN